ncbi:MAG: peptidase [Gemmatimonadetes bacterium]|nr:peptidase [Gemmatimonadota bacterium]
MTDAQDMPRVLVGLPRTHAAEATTADITAADLKTRLYAFADDSMEGREAGKRGGARAEEWLAREARRIGLIPAGDNGTYFQKIPLSSRKADPSSILRVGDQALAYGRDFAPVPRLGAPALGGPPFGGTFNGANVETVFGGRAGDPNTIEPAAVRGKLVVLLAPLDPNGRLRATFWQRDNLVRYAGAAAIAVIALDGPPPPFASAARDTYDDREKPGTTLTAMLISNDAAAAIFGAPAASLTVGTAGKSVSGRVGFIDTPTETPARNVVAILPGSDPALRNSYVAVGAHSDHIGFTPRALEHDSIRVFNSIVRPRGADDPPRPATEAQASLVHAVLDSMHRLLPARADSINNGADDDGSGSVLALEIAESLVKHAPRRSVLFVWHTAEEKGLYGAQYFSDHPTVPRDSIVAQINMDQMGRGEPEDAPPGGRNALVIIGAKRLSTELGTLAETVNARPQHSFALDYAFDRDGDPTQAYCRSDHYMYARYGIPVVFYSAAAWHIDYHMVSDEPQYVAYDRTARIGRYIRDVIEAVANLDHRPVVDKPRPDPNGSCKQ